MMQAPAINRLYGKEKHMDCVNKNAENQNHLFSMHTVTFRADVPKWKWECFKEALAEEKAKSPANIHKYYKEEKRFHYQTTDRWGYMHITLSRNREYNKNFIDLKVNPRTLLDVRCPFAYIATDEDICQCMGRVQNFLELVDEDDLSVYDFYIRRIDYCVNIRLNSVDEVAEYMRLMKKGSHPYSTKRRMGYSQTQKRYIPTQDSFTVYSDTFEFSIYNKYGQMENGRRGYSGEDMRAAEQMVRIEYRAGRGKVRREMIRHGCADLQDFLDRTAEIAAENIPRLIRMCYGSGKFVKYDEAAACIEASGMKRKTKEKMRRMLLNVTRYTLADEKENNPDYKKLMKRFNGLGISPVTIPLRSEFSCFENPLAYIRTNNANHFRPGGEAVMEKP